MKIVVPDYYPQFVCIMDRCVHSCCIGWEIDIDEDSLARYRTIGGKLGEKLQACIACEEEGAHFRLGAGERCPFLTENGLCELILERGEGCLCQICADHPRYRNFFSDREEIGLGLCCEAAGALILKREDKTKLITLEDDGDACEPDEYEQELLDLRSELTAMLQDRSMTLAQRLAEICSYVQLPLPEIDIAWRNFLLSLERLDEAWTQNLRMMECASPSFPVGAEWETAFEQLGVYLLHRHVPGALDDGDLRGRIAFCLLVLQLLQALCCAMLQMDTGFGIDGLVELARMYSAEIEYSDENINAILYELHRRYPEI